jgi:hypothetical protein
MSLKELDKKSLILGVIIGIVLIIAINSLTSADLRLSPDCPGAEDIGSWEDTGDTGSEEGACEEGYVTDPSGLGGCVPDITPGPDPTEDTSYGRGACEGGYVPDPLGGCVPVGVDDPIGYKPPRAPPADWITCNPSSAACGGKGVCEAVSKYSCACRSGSDNPDQAIVMC